MAIGHLLPHNPTASATRPRHRPSSPSLRPTPSPARGHSTAPPSQAVAPTSKPIPIMDPLASAPFGPFAAPPRQDPTMSAAETVAGGPPPVSREATLAQAIRHNDLRALVQNQKRACASARTPRSASPGHTTTLPSSCPRSTVALPALVVGRGEAAGSLTSGDDSETSGESVDVPIVDIRSAHADRAAIVAGRPPSRSQPAAGSSISPSIGASKTASRLPPSSKRRLSCLATYTGIFPDQQQCPPPPARSMSARAASPELRYSLSFADRRGSAPPATRPLMGRKLSMSENSSGESARTRPPSPAPPRFKTSTRRGSGGGGINGFSPLSLRAEGPSPIGTDVVDASTRSALGASSGRARSRSPAPTPRGLVRAASPKPDALPPRAWSPSPRAPSNVTSPLVRDGGLGDGAAKDGPLIVRGFDAPASGPHAGTRPASPAALSSVTLRSKRSSTDMLRTGKSSSSGGGGSGTTRSAGPIVRPRATLLDRTADQRLEVRASRDFERIDEYYAARFAAAAAAAQVTNVEGGGQEAERRGGGSSRDQRAAKRLAEERLRRGYDRTR